LPDALVDRQRFHDAVTPAGMVVIIVLDDRPAFIIGARFLPVAQIDNRQRRKPRIPARGNAFLQPGERSIGIAALRRVQNFGGRGCFFRRNGADTERKLLPLQRSKREPLSQRKQMALLHLEGTFPRRFLLQIGFIAVNRRGKRQRRRKVIIHVGELQCQIPAVLALPGRKFLVAVHQRQQLLFKAEPFRAAGEIKNPAQRAFFKPAEPFGADQRQIGVLQPAADQRRLKCLPRKKRAVFVQTVLPLFISRKIQPELGRHIISGVGRVFKNIARAVFPARIRKADCSVAFAHINSSQPRQAAVKILRKHFPDRFHCNPSCKAFSSLYCSLFAAAASTEKRTKFCDRKKSAANGSTRSGNFEIIRAAPTGKKS